MYVALSVLGLAAVVLFHLGAQTAFARWMPRTRRGKTIAILLGTPANYVLASALILAPAMLRGQPSADRVEVMAVTPGSPADGVLVKGDILLESTAALRARAGAGAAIEVAFVRAGETRRATLAPRDGRIGVQLAPAMLVVSAADAAAQAAVFPAVTAGRIVGGWIEVVSGSVKAEVVGPVGMTAAIRQSLSASWLLGLELLAMLAVYTGLLWLIADAARLVYLYRRAPAAAR